MSGPAPIGLKELISLTALGVNPNSLTFNTVTLESDKYICIRDQTQQGQGQITLIDTSNPTQPLRRPIGADSAIMNPSTKVMALKAGNQLQLFDFASRNKIKMFAATEPVVFWKWISTTVVGIVTQKNVYHWKADDNSDPIKMFERHATLGNAQIINYIADKATEWLCLVGISAKEGGRIAGNLQLYSVQKKMSQPIEGHAASFANIKLEGYDTTLFCFSSRTPQASKFHIIEVGHEKKPEGAPRYDKKQVNVYYPPEMPGDFPVSLQISSKYSIAFLVTKMGYVHLYDLDTATCLYMNRITDTTMFVTTPHTASGGILGINRKGQVLALIMNPQAVVPYVMSKLKNVELAIRLASRNGFAGAEGLFMEQFSQLFNDGKYREAALVAAESPAGFLRTPETIQKFKAVPTEEGKPSCLLIYFQALLERGVLNKVEALELGYQVVQFGKVQLLEKWIKEDKIECSEELGDLIKQSNVNLALAAYIKAKAHPKVIQCLLETGQTNKVVPYAQKVGMTTNSMDLVQMASRYNPKAALDLANALQTQVVTTTAAKPASEHKAMIDMFLGRGMLQEATSYCLDNLKQDIPDYGPLQTQILEANLMNAPKVASAILQQDIWHHFDKNRIGQLCERAGLFQQALENYTDLADVKRVIQNTHVINPEFLLNYFGTLSPEDGVELIDEIVRSNPKGNLKLAVQIAAKYTDQMGAKPLMDIFKRCKVDEALYFYLGAIVNFSQDPDVHFQYIECSCKLGQWAEAERVTRESNFYDPEKLKDYLMEIKAKDPRPLINVCDRFGYVDELVKYMIKNKQMKFVEGYVQRVNPLRCPVVVGALLDLDEDREFISKLIMSVKNMVPVDDLVNEVERRGALKMLLPFLEARIADGATDVSVHSGIAKVYIESNINPEHFLSTNPYYDSRIVGTFCEKRDPYLAYVAYRRGKCDDELMEVTNNAQLFKEQAKYLVERESQELWGKALAENNPYRKLVVDQVISSALLECKQPEQVSSAVKAFMAADLPELLMELLEKLVLHTSNSVFSRNKNLQNLLILTAIKSDRKRVMEYIRRLDAYDGADVAQIAIGAELYEEAYAIYQKFELYDQAADVLLTSLKDFSRAEEYALKVDRPDVWSKLGCVQLENGVISGGIKSLMRAKDPSPYRLVIKAANEHATAEEFADIVKFLKFARNKVKDIKTIDTEIVFGFCKGNRLTDVEEFISQPHGANLDEVGERCYDEGLYDAAKLMFNATSNYAKLAPALVKLGDFKGAVEAARKGDRVTTWRIVCFACVDAKEFRMAQICALNLIVEPNELMDVIDYYLDRGHFNEIIDVMDNGLQSERAHQAMFTELGVLYSKYRDENMLEYLKMWWQRCNVPRLIRTCESAYLFEEVAYLHMQYNEFDNAATVMMEHSGLAWSANGFSDAITKAGNLEVMYRAVKFYIDQHAELLTDLLMILAPKVEASRTITILRNHNNATFGPLGLLPFCKGYLSKAQEANVPEVNDAYNEVLLQEGAILDLRDSVQSFDNFDQQVFAHRLSTHENIEFRRLGTWIYRKMGKYEQALEISKKDKLWKDTIDAIAISKDPELAESIGNYFLSNGLRECFTGLVYACFEFFPPDVALELAWMHKVLDHVMPFLIQTMKEVGQKLMSIQEHIQEKKNEEEEKRQQEEEEINEDPNVLMFGVQNKTNPLLGIAGGPGGNVQTVPQIGWSGPSGAPGMAPGMGPSAGMQRTFALPAPQMTQQQMTQQQMQATQQARMQQATQQARMQQATQQARMQQATQQAKMQQATQQARMQQAKMQQASQMNTRR